MKSWHHYVASLWFPVDRHCMTSLWSHFDRFLNDLHFLINWIYRLRRINDSFFTLYEENTDIKLLLGLGDIKGVTQHQIHWKKLKICKLFCIYKNNYNIRDIFIVVIISARLEFNNLLFYAVSMNSCASNDWWTWAQEFHWDRLKY